MKVRGSSYRPVSKPVSRVSQSRTSSKSSSSGKAVRTTPTPKTSTVSKPTAAKTSKTNTTKTNTAKTNTSSKANGSTAAANKKSTNTASSQKTGILDKAAQGVKKGVTAIANTVEKGYNTLKKEVAKAGKTATDTKKNEKPTAVTKGDKVNATVIRHDARGTKVSSTAAVPVTGGKYGSRGDAPAKTAEKAKALQQEKKELKKAPAGKDKSKKTPASASSQGTVIRHDARGTKTSNKTVIPVTGGEHGSRGKTPGKVAEKVAVLNQIKKEEKKQEKREKQEEQKQRKQEYRPIPATTDERRKGDSRGAYIPKRIAPPEGVDTSKMPESIHNALSVAGMAPGPLGFLSDGINAATYFFEGETKKAAIALGEMVVPAIIGKVGGKVALKVSGKLGTEGVVKKITGETTESAGEAVGKKLQKEITENAAEKAAKVTGETIESGLNSNLLDELANSGVKYNPEDIVAITKTADGKLVWLENGTDTAGLNHIITEHADDFLNKGITQEQIPDYVMNALENGKIVGYQGRGTGRPIYEFTYNGEIHKVAITVGNNGFIVGANPK